VKHKIALAGLTAIIGVIAIENANAQYRMPAPRLPGYWGVAPRLAMPAINGASRLGWGVGRWDSMRRYGPMADPGPWPGLGRSLGIPR
jgi:hypothetical protein